MYWQRGTRVKRRDFKRLVESIKEAGAIRRGEIEPGRTTEFHPNALPDLQPRKRENPFDLTECSE